MLRPRESPGNLKKKSGILNIFRYFQYFLSYPFLSYCYTLCNIFINLKIINEYYVYLFRNITVLVGKVGIILTGHYMFAEEGKKFPLLIRHSYTDTQIICLEMFLDKQLNLLDILRSFTVSFAYEKGEFVSLCLIFS